MRYFLILLVLIIGLVINYNYINDYNKKNNINIVVGNEDIPPSLSLTGIALGPLRGILCNALWLRSVKQALEGEVYDSLQLIDWMTTLQPHSPRIWEYQGWNITYNIAYESRDPYYRWDWVYYGFTLLRDKGLKYNPDNNFNRPIRQQMATTLFDRINKDDFGFHNLFKYNWAVEMLEYFDSDRAEEIEAYAKAPDSIEQLKENKIFSKYYSLCKENLNIDILDFKKYKPTAQSYNAKMNKEELIKAHLLLYSFYKKQRIEKELKLNMDQVLLLNTKYGPFDWRLPQAQVIYWGYEDNHDNYFKTQFNFDITIRQTLLSVMREGTLKRLNKDKKTMIRGANLRVLKVIHNFFDEYLENKNNHIVLKATHLMHKTFVEEATTLLYMYNQTDVAKRLHQHYIEEHPEEKKVTFEKFITKSMKSTLENREDRNTESLIRATLFEAYEFASLLEVDRANGYLNFAKLLYNEHQKKYKKLRQTARLLPPFKSLQKNAIKEFKIQNGIVKENKFDDFIKKVRTLKPIEKIDIH